MRREAEGAVEIEWGGEAWRLLPSRGAVRLARRWLVVADTHFGKAAAFRAAGINCPETTESDLRRLDGALEASGAERLVVLGDFVHAREAMSEAVVGALAAWRARWSGLGVTVVRGNHDRAAGDPPASLAIEMIDEGLEVDGVTLCHDSGRSDRGESIGRADGGRVGGRGRGPSLAGHVHPAARLPDAGRLSLRLPCFLVGGSTMTLPAFGGMTGMHTVRPTAEERVFVVTPDAVVAIPRAGRGPGGRGLRAVD